MQSGLTERYMLVTVSANLAAAAGCVKFGHRLENILL